jgi:hypothetical protein
MLQVKSPNPRDTLFREAMIVLTGASAAHGIIFIAMLAYLVVETVEWVGGVIILFCAAVASPVGPVLAAEGLMGTLAAGIRAALSLQTAVAAGAGMLVFAIPRASNANPNIPIAFDVSLAKFVARKPSEPSTRVGQSKIIDGAEWWVAGIARTLPD